MKVILKEEVDNLGLPGDVVDVADGYGRNFLIPRGLAMQATRGALKEAETLTRARKARQSKTVGAAEEFKKALEQRKLRIPKRMDEKGHLYGSVSIADVQRILKERGHEIERRRIEVGKHIKEIGEHEVTVHLHPEVTAIVPIEVVDEEGEVTLESLEAARAEARAAKEEPQTLEERALAAAEAAEAEAGEQAAEELADAAAATDEDTREDADEAGADQGASALLQAAHEPDAEVADAVTVDDLEDEEAEQEA